MSTIKLKCSSCNKKHSIDCSELHWECVESSERKMGTEKNHEATVDFDCKCGNEIEITFNCWEYPVGVSNHTDHELTGATLEGSDCEPCPDFKR